MLYVFNLNIKINQKVYKTKIKKKKKNLKSLVHTTETVKTKKSL